VKNLVELESGVEVDHNLTHLLELSLLLLNVSFELRNVFLLFIQLGAQTHGKIAAHFVVPRGGFTLVVSGLLRCGLSSESLRFLVHLYLQ
jgi:hypothetical protein